ncbi:MAG TPA: tetratricopeptide repeat protein [Candidatus Aminicenantes bacterium]|nr:tetratricopeptide repeat protein [Candidatus Aminicenantes bacterium]
MKERAVVTVACLCWLTMTGAVLPAAGPDQGVDPFLQGQLQYRKWAPVVAKARRDIVRKDWDRARARLAPVLAACPSHHEALYLTAGALNATGDYPAALSCLERAETSLQEQQSLCTAWREKDRVRLEQEEKTVRELMSGEATRGKVHASCARGDTTIIPGKPEPGSESPAPLASPAPEDFRVPASYSFLHGNCLFQLHRFAEAEGQYRLAIATDPGYAPAYHNLINLLLVGKRPAEAAAEMKMADDAHVRIDPRLRQAVSAAVQEGIQ